MGTKAGQNHGVGRWSVAIGVAGVLAGCSPAANLSQSGMKMPEASASAPAVHEKRTAIPAPPPAAAANLGDLFTQACGRPTPLFAEACLPADEAHRELFRIFVVRAEAEVAATPIGARDPTLGVRIARAHQATGDLPAEIAAYRRMLTEELSDPVLEVLERGDPASGLAPDTVRYFDQRRWLTSVYQALQTASFMAFDYPGTAAVSVEMARASRLDRSVRYEGVRNAMLLFRTLGKPDAARALQPLATNLASTSSERAETDLLLATLSGKPDDLRAVYTRYRDTSGAEEYVLEAAWRLVELERARGGPPRDELLENVVDAWKRFDGTMEGSKKTHAAPFARWVGAAEYGLLASELKEYGRHTTCATDAVQRETLVLERRSDDVHKRHAAPSDRGMLLANLGAAIESCHHSSPSRPVDSPFAIHLYARALSEVDLPRSPAIAHGALRILALKDRLGPARADLFELSLAGSSAPDAEQTLLRAHAYFSLRTDGRESLAGLPTPIAP